jgi:hypothetical protein
VHKIDDTTATGTLASISDGKLTLTAGLPIVIPLDEISQIAMKDQPAPKPPAAPVQPAPAPVVEDGPNLGGTLLGALFGSGHSTARIEAGPSSTVAPVQTPAPAVAATTAPASQPTLNQSVQIQLTDGDQFHAMLQSWANQKVSLHLSAGTSLSLPSTGIAEIWVGDSQQQTKARQLNIEPGPEDVALVAKDDGIVAVKGLVQGIIGNALVFNYDNQDRKINLSKLVGVLLRSNSPAPITGFHQLVHTDTGDDFSGTVSAIDGNSLVLASPGGATLTLALSSITTIDFLNGRVTYLTDLKPAKVEQTPYFGRVIPYKINQSLNGGPLVLSDGPAARGIAVHSRCVLQYDVRSGFDRFKTRLGFQQPEGHDGRVLARVLGDGKPLYENPDARGDQPPIEIDVPLAGIRTLTLEIDFGNDQDVGDRVVWANPRLLRGK